MFFIKAASIILFNLLLGFMIPFSLKMVLFYPRKKLYFFDHKVPLTPGLLYRKKTALIDWLKFRLYEYFKLVRSKDRINRISQWENKIYDLAWEKFEFIDSLSFIPQTWRDKFHHLLALVFYEIGKQFFRSFIPYLLNKYKAKKYITKLDEKLDVDLIFDYYNRYVNRYLTYFFLLVYFLIGFANMIWYLIIGK